MLPDFRDSEPPLQIFHSGDSRPDIPCFDPGSDGAGTAPPPPRPRPILQVERVFRTDDGRVFQFIGERWRADETWAADPEVQFEPDLSRPGESYGFRLIDCANGRVYAPLEKGEVEALAGRGRRGEDPPRPDGRRRSGRSGDIRPA